MLLALVQAIAGAVYVLELEQGSYGFSHLFSTIAGRRFYRRRC
jgi:hypothetical protein